MFPTFTVVAIVLVGVDELFESLGVDDDEPDEEAVADEEVAADAALLGDTDVDDVTI